MYTGYNCNSKLCEACSMMVRCKMVGLPSAVRTIRMKHNSLSHRSEALEPDCASQDEEYGGFGGAHCMVPSGYGSLLAPQAASLDVRLSCPVKLVQDSSEGVQVTTESGALWSRRVTVV